MLFTGRLTSGAEVKELKNDRKVTSFTVALNTTFKTQTGEKKKKTVFVDCSYWVNPGLAVYLTKGAIVEISGWVEAEAYLSNKDRTAKSRLVCSVDQIRLFSSVTTASPTEAQSKKVDNPQDNDLSMIDAANTANNTGADDDDLPF